MYIKSAGVCGVQSQSLSGPSPSIVEAVGIVREVVQVGSGGRVPVCSHVGGDVSCQGARRSAPAKAERLFLELLTGQRGLSLTVKIARCFDDMLPSGFHC
jgi:hypothetical protein